ncbi:MAG: 30S ribosomal protein S2 [Candidatus Lokiarchaeota archaeon]|nr:30S ribosomal protein S2 [Candidatus Lokiarchaeota archaeon]
MFELAENVEGPDLLIPRDQYLAAGIHIGTQIKTKDMMPFIYRITRSGLYVIDIRKTDERILTAAKMIARYEPQHVLVISARRYGHRPIKKFCEITKCHPVAGRFIPGTLTNYTAGEYHETDLVIVGDPRADKQVVKEASRIKVPIISLCDTDNNLTDIDLVIPANNRGRKALALIFWLLARQVLLERGVITTSEEYNVELDEFHTSKEFIVAPKTE